MKRQAIRGAKREALEDLAWTEFYAKQGDHYAAQAVHDVEARATALNRMARKARR